MLWKLSIIGSAAAATSLRHGSHGMKIDSDTKALDQQGEDEEILPGAAIDAFMEDQKKTNDDQKKTNEDQKNTNANLEKKIKWKTNRNRNDIDDMKKQILEYENREVGMQHNMSEMAQEIKEMREMEQKMSDMAQKMSDMEHEIKEVRSHTDQEVGNIQDVIDVMGTKISANTQSVDDEQQSIDEQQNQMLQTLCEQAGDTCGGYQCQDGQCLYAPITHESIFSTILSSLCIFRIIWH